MAALRCVYCDLDGTLLGRRGSLLHDGEGAFSHLGVRALEACHRADVEVVLFSGRRRVQVFEDARLIGQTAYIYEIGCGLSIDGEETYLTDPLEPTAFASVWQQIEDSGAPALLMERFAGRLEPHDPWHVHREFTHLFRGTIDAFEADAALEAAGLGHLRLVDNGGVAARASLPGDRPPRALHLVPRAASKARAVAAHARARGYAPEACIAVGDSREDLGAAVAVAAFWVVANALEKDPQMREAIAGVPNVRVAEERHGAGVYEAILTELGERRP
jgi:hydroxymethylpyrimidine pyrophosphatase-like HAD family hydrolase